MCHRALKVKFKVVVRPTMLYGGVLVGEELAHQKDESSRNEDVEMDV